MLSNNLFEPIDKRCVYIKKIKGFCIKQYTKKKMKENEFYQPYY